MKILICGYYGFGNFGDDILLKAGFNIAKNKYPDAELHVFANNQENINSKSIIPYRNYISALLGENVFLVDWRNNTKYDLVLHCGGGVFFDYKNGNILDLILNFFIRLFGVNLYARIASSLRFFFKKENLYFGKRKFGIGIGAGPYTCASKRLVKEAEIIGSFDKIAVRDSLSLKQLESFRYKGELFLHTDLAFASDYWIKRNDLLFNNNKKNKIGVIVSAGKIGTREILNQYELGLLFPGSDVVFIFLQENYDNVVIERLSEIGGEKLIWSPWSMSLENFIEQLSNFSLIVTNRAHGAIIPSLMLIPSIIINCDQKLRQVNKMLYNSSSIIDPSRISLDINSLAFDVIEKNKNKKLIQADVNVNYKKAIEMIDNVFGK